MDYANVNSTEKVKARIRLSLEKEIDTLTASESSDLQKTDCDALRALGYRITGLSFFYDKIGAPTAEGVQPSPKR